MAPEEPKTHYRINTGFTVDLRNTFPTINHRHRPGFLSPPSKRRNRPAQRAKCWINSYRSKLHLVHFLSDKKRDSITISVRRRPRYHSSGRLLADTRNKQCNWDSCQFINKFSEPESGGNALDLWQPICRPLATQSVANKRLSFGLQ